MGNNDWIPDKGGDFREEVDFRLESEVPRENSKPSPRLTREQINAKKGMRLPGHLRAYLILEIISTNKTGVAIARKFGVTPQNVYRLKAGIVRELLARKTKILYRKNGELFFQ